MSHELTMGQIKLTLQKVQITMIIDGSHMHKVTSVLRVTDAIMTSLNNQVVVLSVSLYYDTCYQYNQWMWP